MQWIRLYLEARNDAKLRTLTDTEHRIWFHLLCYGAEQAERGRIDATDEELLAIEVADGDTAQLRETVQKLMRLRILAREGDALTFIHFAERQYDKPSDTPAAVRSRVRRHRAQANGDTPADDPRPPAPRPPAAPTAAAADSAPIAEPPPAPDPLPGTEPPPDIDDPFDDDPPDGGGLSTGDGPPLPLPPAQPMPGLELLPPATASVTPCNAVKRAETRILRTETEQSRTEQNRPERETGPGAKGETNARPPDRPPVSLVGDFGLPAAPPELPTVLLTPQGGERAPLLSRAWRWCCTQRGRTPQSRAELFPITLDWAELEQLEIALREYLDLSPHAPFATLMQDLFVTGHYAAHFRQARYKFAVMQRALGNEITYLRRRGGCASPSRRWKGGMPLGTFAKAGVA